MKFANWFVLLPVLLLLSAALVKADQFGDYGYSTDGSTVTITNYTGTNSDIVIPDICLQKTRQNAVTIRRKIFKIPLFSNVFKNRISSHNLKVVGSNPAPATIQNPLY